MFHVVEQSGSLLLKAISKDLNDLWKRQRNNLVLRAHLEIGQLCSCELNQISQCFLHNYTAKVDRKGLIALSHCMGYKV